jgi:hypothetical protein
VTGGDCTLGYVYLYVYIPQVLAFASAPETSNGYFRMVRMPCTSIRPKSSI